MNNFSLKLVALVSMILDHCGLLLGFFPLRVVGRLSLPAFAIAIADSAKFCSDRRRYSSRILALAFLSQIPYYLFFHKAQLNVIFSLYLGVLFCWFSSACLVGFLSLLLVKNLLQVSISSIFEYQYVAILLVPLAYYLSCYRLFSLEYVFLICLSFVLFYFYFLDYGPIVLVSFSSFFIFSLVYSHSRGPSSRWVGFLYPAHLVVLSVFKYAFPLN